MLKDIILWNYKRGTWQYDVFCLLIIAFIFLTPKSWFDRKEKLATQTARVVVKRGDFSPEKSEMKKTREEFERRPRRSESGEDFYEIDVR